MCHCWISMWALLIQTNIFNSIIYYKHTCTPSSPRTHSSLMTMVNHHLYVICKADLSSVSICSHFSLREKGSYLRVDLIFMLVMEGHRSKRVSVWAELCIRIFESAFSDEKLPRCMLSFVCQPAIQSTISSTITLISSSKRFDILFLSMAVPDKTAVKTKDVV